MILATWNIRGVNEPFNQREVCSLIHKHKISVLGLLETRVHEAKHLRIIQSMLPGWSFLTNYISHHNGRIWVLWDTVSAHITPLSITDQVIHVEILLTQSQTKLAASFIYGHNYYMLRRSLWASLRSFSSFYQDFPWLVLGDFNIIRKVEDRAGGDQSWPSYIDEFNECCQDTLLDDLRNTGRHLTWSRGSGNNFISRKLDRALVNPPWLSYFTEVESTTLAPGESDHSPLLINTGLHTSEDLPFGSSISG